jgi:hypothetical protein
MVDRVIHCIEGGNEGRAVDEAVSLMQQLGLATILTACSKCHGEIDAQCVFGKGSVCNCDSAN